MSASALPPSTSSSTPSPSASSLAGPSRQPQLRASCRHCRNRKLKCSGGNPCQVCDKRNTPCVYDVASRMGRPPGKARGAAASSSSSSSAASPVGRILDALFASLYAAAPDPQSSSAANDATTPTSAAFALALRAYAARRGSHPVQMSASEAMEQQPCGPAIYPFLLPIVVRDLVETCSWLLGPFVKPDKDAIERGEAPRRPSYYAIALASDTTPCMPGSRKSMAEHDAASLEEMVPGDKRRTALVKDWLTTHPIASIVSPRLRAAILSSSPKRPPSALAALVLAEALMLEAGEATARSERLLHHAYSTFASETLTGKRRIEMAVTAALFSWHHLCHTNVRVGTAYMAFACQLMASHSRRGAKGGRADDAGASSDEAILTADDRASANCLRVMLACQTTWAFCQLDVSLGSLLSRLTDPRSLLFDCAKGQGRSGRQTRSANLACGMSQVILQALGEVETPSASSTRPGGLDTRSLRRKLIDTAPDLSQDRGLRVFNDTIRATLGLHLLFLGYGAGSQGSDELAQLVDDVVNECLDISPLVDVLDESRRRRERVSPGSAMENVLAKVAGREDADKLLLGLDLRKMAVEGEGAASDEQDQPLSKRSPASTAEEDANLELDSPMLCVAASMHLEASSYALERLVDAVGPIGAPVPASDDAAAWDARRARIADAARQLIRAAAMGWLTETITHKRLKERLQSCVDRLQPLLRAAPRPPGALAAAPVPMSMSVSSAPAPSYGMPAADALDPSSWTGWSNGVSSSTPPVFGVVQDTRPWADVLYTIDDFVAGGTDSSWWHPSVSSRTGVPTISPNQAQVGTVGAQQAKAQPHQSQSLGGALAFAQSPDEAVAAAAGWAASSQPAHRITPQVTTQASLTPFPIDRNALYGPESSWLPRTANDMSPATYASLPQPAPYRNGSAGENSTTTPGSYSNSGSYSGSGSGSGSGSDSEGNPEEAIMDLLWGALEGMDDDARMGVVGPGTAVPMRREDDISPYTIAAANGAEGPEHWN